MSTTLTSAAVDGDDLEVSAVDLIPMREHNWQQQRQNRATPEPLAQLETDRERFVAADAFGAGYMACWGDYREVILAWYAAQGTARDV